MNKAVRKLIIKNKDFILTSLLGLIFAIGFGFFLYKGYLGKSQEDLIILFSYILIIGLYMININSLLVSLPVKDKLTGKLEFILGSGIGIRSYIRAYGLEIWRMSSLAPFLVFYISYVAYDFSLAFAYVMVIYLTSILMAYLMTMSMVIFSLYQENFKFFKNLLFFTTSFLIYLVGNLSRSIIGFLNEKGIEISFFLIGINLCLILVFCFYLFFKFKNITNEEIIIREGSWS